MTRDERHTNSGRPPEEGTEHSPAPTTVRRSDGQLADHWVMSDDERTRGFVRPVRLSYRHVGPPGPRFPLRDLTDEERARHPEWARYEPYPESESPKVGRGWTQARCGVVTSMPRKIAETYAARPDYYVSTFCCGCGRYRPVGEDGEFTWAGTDERVGA